MRTERGLLIGREKRTRTRRETQSEKLRKTRKNRRPRRTNSSVNRRTNPRQKGSRRCRKVRENQRIIACRVRSIFSTKRRIRENQRSWTVTTNRGVRRR